MDSARPLAGIRMVNFGWYWVVSTTTHLLADMGAEVVKVDSRAKLDTLRTLAPFLGRVEDPDHAMWSHNLHRSTMDVTADLSTAEGRRLALDLVAESDVVTENFTVGTMAKLGLDYASLRRVRPDLVMLSATAAGQWGPRSNMYSFGGVLSALSGIDALNGYEGERPIPVGTAILDPYEGSLGAFAVLAALRHREATGEGRYIDFGQWEGAAAGLGPLVLDYQWNGRVPPRVGNRDPQFVPHNVYRSKGSDSWVAIAVYDEEEWQGLVRAMGSPSWASEARFADKFRRKRNERELDALIAAWTAHRTNDKVAELLQHHGVAATPSPSAKELYTDPHWKARDSWVEVEHPHGRETIYGVHWKFSETPGAVQSPSPLLGQHNEAIFANLLGVPDDTFKRLTETRVIY